MGFQFRLEIVEGPFLLKLTRTLPTQTRRDAWVEVNLDALEQNAKAVRQFLPAHVTLMAIVKADAYGHGAVMSIPVLESAGVEIVGVASLDEALQIRQSGSEIPILVIGPVPDWSIETAIAHDIQLTLFAQEQLESLMASCDRLKRAVKIHVKLDTGMHRIGLAPETAAEMIIRCQKHLYIDVQGVFTHLACADNLAKNQMQYQRWQNVLKALPERPKYCHVDNSVGAVSFPDGHENLVRMGIAFYGYLPDWPNHSLPLRPVMGLKARVIRLVTVEAGEGVSYGHHFQIESNIEKSSRVIATVPLGYADGIPRLLSGKMFARVQGVLCPQVGTITMDQMMFDVTEVFDQGGCVTYGETITLLDETLTLTHWAKEIGTIEYELMCALRVRLPKVYTRQSHLL
jgi:alanine racemase